GADPLRLTWTKANGNVYRARTDKRFHQLFLDGRMMVEARWPNQAFPEQAWDKTTWAVAGKGSRYGLMVDAALASTGVDFTGCVATLNVGSFRTYRRLVQGHAPGRDRFEYRQEMGVHVPSKRHFAGFDRYWLLGPLAALDAPGEWHLDRDTGILHLWTPDGASPADSCLEVKQRDHAVEAEKVDYVVIAGFHCVAATFRLAECNHCVVRDCHLRYPAWPAGLEPPAETLIYGTRNVMRDSSSVFGDGSVVTVRGEHNTVANCLFHDFDFTALGRGHAVSLAGSARSTARHCTVFAFGSSEGICAAGKGPSEVAYNHVHHGGLCQSDGALIQCSGLRQAGTAIHHNWVHDHNAFNWGGNGVRGDDLTRDLLVHHNVAWNCPNKGIIVKGNRNRVYNNSCFDNPTIDLLLWSSPTPHKSFRPRQWDHLLEQQNAHSEAFNNYAPVLTGQMPHEIRRAKKLEPPAGALSHNYRPPEPMLLDAKALTFRDDPALLADPARLDFRPRAGSPLVDAGREITGITDGYVGKAPDIGAYESGGKRWVPGCRNAVWVLPGADACGTIHRVRMVLAMPTLAPVTVEVQGESGATVSPGRLTFAPETWHRAQWLEIRGGGDRPPQLRVRIPAYELDDVIDLADLDPLEGARSAFRTIP
ncbi:MAG: right-handed parallel beta-helix repeat-containing protein, partial [Planctomycetota bacterium]|nr:right-handed parallel beta-helix repeat-containing protein [Planctomycetota bacterium]